LKVRARLVPAGISAIALTGLVLYLAGPAWAADEVDRIREKAQEFFAALTKGEYDLLVRGKEPQIGRTHRDFDYLFKPKKVDLLVQQAKTTSDPAEARAMELLAVALRHAAVRSYAAQDIDQMYEFMMTATVDVDGTTIPFGEIPRVLSREEDRDVRRQIYIAYNKPLEPLGVFKRGIISKMDVQMLAQVREFDPTVLQTQAKGFLESTDELYVADMERLLDEQLGMDLRQARGYDIPLLLKGGWLDGGLSSDKADDIAKETLHGMDLKAEKSRLELKPMVFCGCGEMPRVFPLRVPDEIKMCYSEATGAVDYAAHLFVRGKAEYYASIRQPRWFELRTLGDGSLSEAAGLLFQGLMANEIWLRERAGLNAESAKAVARHYAFVSLFEARQACMSTLFQMEVYSGAEDPGEVYSKLLESYMKWDPVLDRNREALALDDLDSADVARGYFLAWELKDALETQFGDRWFESVEAGAFLKNLWAPGQRLDANAMAKALGYDSADPTCLVDDLSKEIPIGD
jgi:hypothetical protein